MRMLPAEEDACVEQGSDLRNSYCTQVTKRLGVSGSSLSWLISNSEIENLLGPNDIFISVEKAKKM